MITKLKAIIFALFIFQLSSVHAAYTTMTLEGVQQANGVWTAAGVMDTQGFVRTTGAVSLYGHSASTSVTMAADLTALRSMSKLAIKAAGPIALAATAYDIYSYLNTQDIKPCGNDFCTGTLTLSNPIGSGSCSLYSLNGMTYSGYTAQQCIDRNIMDMTSANYYVVFMGWTSYTDTGVQYEYKGIFNRYRVSNNTLLDSKPYSFYVPKTTPPSYTGTLVPQSKWDSLELSIPLLISALNNLPSLIGKPIPITSSKFTPFSSWYGEPYFKDGNWYRDRMDISPCPTASQPTRVCVDIGPQKFEGATNPQTVPSQATGTATGSTPKENADFCKKNPQSIACAELGELEDESLEVDERPVDVSYTPWGSSNAQCPADKIIPLWDSQTIALSYSPICQFASLLRPLVIALAFVAAGFIVAGITRKGGGDA